MNQTTINILIDNCKDISTTKYRTTMSLQWRISSLIIGNAFFKTALFNYKMEVQLYVSVNREINANNAKHLNKTLL